MGRQDRTWSLLCSGKLCGGGDEADHSRGQSHGLGRPQPGPAGQGPLPVLHTPAQMTQAKGRSPGLGPVHSGGCAGGLKAARDPGRWTEHPETMPRPTGVPGPRLRILADSGPPRAVCGLATLPPWPPPTSPSPLPPLPTPFPPVLLVGLTHLHSFPLSAASGPPIVCELQGGRTHQSNYPVTWRDPARATLSQ